jgi:anti-sigma-K factor RskA
MSPSAFPPEDQDVIYELYALGLLEAAEMAEIRAKLEAQDPETVAGVQKALLLTSSLAYVAPEAKPPQALRRRLLLAAGAPERGFGWGWIAGLATACLALLVIVFNIRQDVERRETQLAELRRSLSDSQAQLARVNATANELYDFLSQPATINIKFGDTQPAPPRGRAYLNAEKGVVLFAANLPNMPAGKIFEMWLIPKGEGAKPVPAGLFRGENGKGINYRPGAVDLKNVAAIAVTLEPEAGSTTPTMPILFVAPVTGE